MLDYFLFPLIAVILSLTTINTVFTTTKNTWASGLSGLFTFCGTMWMAGYFLYGLVLAACFSALLLVSSHLDEDDCLSSSTASRKNPQP